MNWDKVISQSSVKAGLRAAIIGNRVAHAYLIHGPDGSGKKALALAFAQALLCEGGVEGDICGQCNACHKMSSLVHPDLHLVLPYAGDQSIDEVRLRLDHLARDPYAPVDFVHAPNGIGSEKLSTNKQVIVKRERVDQEIIRPMSFTRVEGKYKIAILPDAELVNRSGANAILKLLEEPPANTVFILTTSRLDRMLPTIVSRCQQLRLVRLEVEEIRAALMERFDVDESQADAIARLADGSLTRAIQIASNADLLDQRQLVIDFARASWTRDVHTIYSLAQQLSGGGRESVKSALSAMLTWLRDLVVLQATGDTSRIVNSDQQTSTVKFLANLPNADLHQMVSVVEEAIHLATRNVNTTIIFITLSDALHDLMHGKTVDGLYVPLAQQGELTT